MGVSVAAASVFWLYLFNPTMGLLNRFLEMFGLETIGWLTDPDWALIAVSVTTIWMNIGFTFLIFLVVCNRLILLYMKVQILKVQAIFISLEELQFRCCRQHYFLLLQFPL